jgi:Tfp pilus assembly protein PilF
MLQATAAQPGLGEWLRDHRKSVYGTLVGLAVVGYGAYFYVSVYHPALLRRSPAAATVTGKPTTPPTTPAPPIQGEIETASAAAPSIPAENVREAATPTVGPASSKHSARPTDGPKRMAEPRTDPKPSAPAPDRVARQARDSISVQPGGEAPRLNPQLADAYEALRSGRLQDAQRLYDSLLRTEPRNVDALLGRAMVARQQGDMDLATRHLFQVLQLDPSNTLAQGALISLIGGADPQSAESRLKSLVAKDPSAFLYFTLGNLYADQGNWSAAQAAYFQAHHLQRDNSDYAFNLAVSLEHLSQPKLALNFYRQALELARVSGRANFDYAVVQERIARLAAGVD